MKSQSGTLDDVISLRDEGKKEYRSLAGDLTRAFSLCATTEPAERLNLEVGFHKAMKASIVKMPADDNRKKTTAQLDAELNQLNPKSLSSNETVDTSGAVGLNKPNIAILSDEFLAEAGGMKRKNQAVKLLQRLLIGNIRQLARRNFMQSKNFSELLVASILKYQNRTIETTQVIMELIALAKEITDAEKRENFTGFSDEELAFCDALAEEEIVMEQTRLMCQSETGNPKIVLSNSTI